MNGTTSTGKCAICKPLVAWSRPSQLCPEGLRLHDELREASVRYINLCGRMDPPAGSVELAREERQRARERFAEHTGEPT